MKRVILFLPLVVVILMGVVFFAGIGKDPTRLDSALVGKPVPAFALSSLQNREEVLREDLFKGQPALLNVWGTWCPACRDEHDDLVWLARDQGVRIVGLNYKDDRAAALKWLSDLGDPYAISIYDPKGELGFDLGVYGAPETFVIDGDGIVRHRHVGVVNQQVWENDIKPLLDQFGSAG